MQRCTLGVLGTRQPENPGDNKGKNEFNGLVAGFLLLVAGLELKENE
jgi:hypothetical protein